MAEISSKRIPYASQLILKIDLKKKKPQKQSLQVLWPTEIISYLLHSLSVVVKHKVMRFPPNTFLSLFAVILQFEEHMSLCSDKFSTAAVCWAVEVLKIKETVERRSIADSLMWVYRTVLSTPVWESSVQEQQLAFLPSVSRTVSRLATSLWSSAGHRGLFFLNRRWRSIYVPPS